ncbi:MAG: single-stranded DNA-binding protein [Elusimicrobia bacterium]|nr:single-stranded DNA-binding protein [Elusimicrobiota bacterium]
MATSLRLPEQNQVFLVGRLTRDPDVRFTQKGQPMCRFSIAVNRRYKDSSSGEWTDDVTFVNVVVWGPAAERCKDKLKKGSPVHVEGRLSSYEYEDKATGQKRKSIEVVSRRLQFLSFTPQQTEASESNEAEETPAGEAPHSAEVSDDVPF